MNKSLYVNILAFCLCFQLAYTKDTLLFHAKVLKSREAKRVENSNRTCDITVDESLHSASLYINKEIIQNNTDEQTLGEVLKAVFKKKPAISSKKANDSIMELKVIANKPGTKLQAYENFQQIGETKRFKTFDVYVFATFENDNYPQDAERGIVRLLLNPIIRSGSCR